MKILVFTSRLIVGSLFIVSGLIKANDPTGFSYKLEDYFAPDVLGLEFLVPFALALAKRTQHGPKTSPKYTNMTSQRIPKCPKKDVGSNCF